MLLAFASAVQLSITEEELADLLCRFVRTFYPQSQCSLYLLRDREVVQMLRLDASGIDEFLPETCLGLRSLNLHAFPSSLGSECPGLTGGVFRICAPIASFRAPHGVLHIAWEDTNQFEDESKVLAELAILTDVTAGALGKLRMVEDARREAQTDLLTGLSTPRIFEERLKRDLARAKHSKNELALGLLDLDGFKSYNDSCGHLAGNSILSGFGDILQKSIRPGDLAARVGGDEFALVWPNSPLDVALRRAEEVQQQLTTLPQIPGTQKLTVSIGIAISNAGVRALDLQHSADGALYRSKREGRNRISAVHNAEFCSDI
jgi:diguanylate cyclase (GGDEF)-like protein